MKKLCVRSRMWNRHIFPIFVDHSQSLFRFAPREIGIGYIFVPSAYPNLLCSWLAIHLPSRTNMANVTMVSDQIFDVQHTFLLDVLAWKPVRVGTNKSESAHHWWEICLQFTSLHFCCKVLKNRHGLQHASLLLVSGNLSGLNIAMHCNTLLQWHFDMEHWSVAVLSPGLRRFWLEASLRLPVPLAFGFTCKSDDDG